MTDDELAVLVDAIIEESGFSGVVRIDRGGEILLERTAGWSHRAHGVAMTSQTRLAMASGSKGLTAVAVLSLAADGTLPLGTPARELLDDDLPLIDDRVTVEHLLAHRSGIGDYLDESDDGQIDDYLAVLDGHPQVCAPGERFAYNNAGFVVLAILASRAAGTDFADLVRRRVCDPAGMIDTEFLRSDSLPERTALGYLDRQGHRSNVLHLPVRGSGDGGAYTTVEDVHRLWTALRDGIVLDPPLVAMAWRPRSVSPEGGRYGLGFWLHASGSAVLLEGYDAGVSFRSALDPDSDTVYTVIANWSDGAWPLARALDRHLLGG